ncbi:MAG: tetratricopeptide repeat protein [Verrucomicrobiota bacterium]
MNPAAAIAVDKMRRTTLRFVTNQHRVPPLAAAGCVLVLLLAVSCGGRPNGDMLAQAETALDEGNFKRASELAQRAAKSENHRTDGLVLGGIAQALAGKDQEAADTLRQAWQGAPDHFYAAYFFGWSLARMQQYGEALEPLEQAVQLRPDHTQARILLGRCCLEQNLPAGVEHLQELDRRNALANADERAVLHNDVAYLLVMADQHRQARQEFDQAADLDPDNPRILQNKAILLDRYLDDPRTARRFYIRALAAYQKRNEDGPQDAIRQRLRQLSSTR